MVAAPFRAAMRSMRCAVLERESRYQTPVPRPDLRGVRLRVDVSEAGSRIAGGWTRENADLRRQRVCGRRIGDVGAVEDIREFDANIDPVALLDAPFPAEIHVFHRPPLRTVIGIVSGRGAELAGRRIDPRSRIQYEGRIRIEAMAVEVLREQRLARGTGSAGV